MPTFRSGGTLVDIANFEALYRAMEDVDFSGRPRGDTDIR
jgi:hypothetical protein